MIVNNGTIRSARLSAISIHWFSCLLVFLWCTRVIGKHTSVSVNALVEVAQDKKDSSSTSPTRTVTMQCNGMCDHLSPDKLPCIYYQVKKDCESSYHSSCLEDNTPFTYRCINPSQENHDQTINHWAFKVSNDPNIIRQAIEEYDSAVSGISSKSVVINGSDIDQIDLELDPTFLHYFTLTVPTKENVPVVVTAKTLDSITQLTYIMFAGLDLSTWVNAPTFPNLETLILSSCHFQMWPFAGELPVLKSAYISLNTFESSSDWPLPPTLERLHIDHNGLEFFPSTISQMTNLKELIGRGNRFGQISTGSIVSPVLSTLDLSNCSLQTFPEDISILTSLEELILSFNPSLQNIPEDVLPSSLKSLNVANCGLLGLSEQIRSGTWSFIDLSNNPLSTSSGVLDTITWTAESIALESLDLVSIPSNVFNSSSPTHTLKLSHNLQFGNNFQVSQLPQGLHILEIKNVSLHEIPMELSQMEQLFYVDFSHNPLDEIPPGTLSPSLTTIILANCSLKNTPKDLNAMNQTLQKLDLSWNIFVELNMKNLMMLDALNLTGNHLSSIPPSVFALTKLKSLDLRDNSIQNVHLKQEEFNFFQKLDELYLDKEALLPANECVQPTILRGKEFYYEICAPGSELLRNQSKRKKNDGKEQDEELISQRNNQKNAGSTRLVSVGVLGGLVFIFVAFLVVYRRKYTSYQQPLTDKSVDFPFNRHQQHDLERGNTINSSLAYSSASIGMTNSSSLWKDEDLLQWRIEFQQLILIHPIAKGAHGVVYLATYNGQNVAAKRLNDSLRAERHTIDQFIQEIKLLSRFHHDKIVQFVGVCWTMETDLQVVLEFMPNGDLHTFLESLRQHSDQKVGKAAVKTNWPWDVRKLSIALDVAEALVYLHSVQPKVLHRDLKSRNILLDENFRAKIADFGVSRHLSDHATMTAEVGTARWIAPEVLMGVKDYDETVDIYSYGVFLAHLDSHELPFSDIAHSNGEPLSEVTLCELLISGALQPTISLTCPLEVEKLILRCLSRNPEERPNGMEITYELRQELKALTSGQSIYDKETEI